MKLTGKCLKNYDDFLIKKYGVFSCNIDLEPCQNALIIEFFDSVGIYICTGIHKYNGNSNGFNSCIEQLQKETIFFFALKTRIEATNAAIIKANDCYNQNNHYLYNS